VAAKVDGPYKGVRVTFRHRPTVWCRFIRQSKFMTYDTHCHTTEQDLNDPQTTANEVENIIVTRSIFKWSNSIESVFYNYYSICIDYDKL